jgi:hypothetical protein
LGKTVVIELLRKLPISFCGKAVITDSPFFFRGINGSGIDFAVRMQTLILGNLFTGYRCQTADPKAVKIKTV